MDMKKAYGIIAFTLLFCTGIIAQKSDLLELIDETPALSTFRAALDSVNLSEILTADHSYTVLAPTNEAFAVLGQGMLDTLFSVENRVVLRAVVSCHIVTESVDSDELRDEQSISTLQGESLKVDLKNGIQIDQANVLKTDKPASNGNLYIIDRLLFPPSMRK